MSFIKYDHPIRFKIAIQNCLSEQHSICEELYPCPFRQFLLESDSVTNKVSFLSPKLREYVIEIEFTS